MTYSLPLKWFMVFLVIGAACSSCQCLTPVSRRHGSWWTLGMLMGSGVLCFVVAGLIVVLALPVALSRLIRR